MIIVQYRNNTKYNYRICSQNELVFDFLWKKVASVTDIPFTAKESELTATGQCIFALPFYAIIIHFLFASSLCLAF